MAKKKKDIHVTLTLDEKGNLNINSNLSPIASVKLLAEAQSIILTDVMNGEEKESTDAKGEVNEEEILKN